LRSQNRSRLAPRHSSTLRGRNNRPFAEGQGCFNSSQRGPLPCGRSFENRIRSNYLQGVASSPATDRFRLNGLHRFHGAYFSAANGRPTISASSGFRAKKKKKAPLRFRGTANTATNGSRRRRLRRSQKSGGGSVGPRSRCPSGVAEDFEAHSVTALRRRHAPCSMRKRTGRPETARPRGTPGRGVIRRFFDYSPVCLRSRTGCRWTSVPSRFVSEITATQNPSPLCGRTIVGRNLPHGNFGCGSNSDESLRIFWIEWSHSSRIRVLKHPVAAVTYSFRGSRLNCNPPTKVKFLKTEDERTYLSS